MPGSSARAWAIPGTAAAGGGITGERAREARRALIVYTIGFAALAADPPLVASQGATPPHAEPVASFRLGLGWLIAGIVGS